MSNRRLTLKRPAVCKSKDRLCGNCSMDAELPGNIFHVGQVIQVQVQLFCDPLPADQSFKYQVYGGFALVLGEQLIAPNNLYTFDVLCPAVAGDYVFVNIALNGQNCSFIGEVEVFITP